MNNFLLNNKATGPERGTVYFAKVVRFHPMTNTIDAVEAVDGGRSFPACPILCSMPAGFSFGERYFPTHDDNNSEVEFVNSAGDIYCVVMYVENDYNSCIVIGFLFPTQSTLSIDEHGLHIYRHESDVIWMIRGDGTVQIYHPSGSFIKIGDNDTNEVDSAIEKDGLYPSTVDDLYLRPPSDYNKSKTSNLFIKWYQGQKVVIDSSGNIELQTRDAASTITMTPDGTVTINTTNEINATTKNANIVASEDVSVTAKNVNVIADTEVNVTTPLAKLTGNLEVTGTAVVDTAFTGTLLCWTASGVNHIQFFVNKGIIVGVGPPLP